MNFSTIKEYAYANGVLRAQIGGSGVTYLLADHLGTPRMAMDPNRHVVWRWDGDLFGEVALNDDPNGELNSVTVNLQFPGQYHEMETGLTYNYFRDFEPSIGESLAVQKRAQHGGGGIRW